MITLVTILLLCIITFGIIMAIFGITTYYAYKYKKHYVAIVVSGYIIYSIIVFSLWCWGYDILYKVIK